MISLNDSWNRFLQGEQTAFDDVVRVSFDGLTLFLYGIVGDYGAAEDIAIDVYAYVAAHPGKYEPRSSPKTYLYMLGRSRALNHLKKEKRHPVTELTEDVRTEDIPESILLKKEQNEALYAALDALPEEVRNAIWLTYFEDLSYEETARVMKKTKKQVDHLLTKGRQLLRERLTEET